MNPPNILFIILCSLILLSTNAYATESLKATASVTPKLTLTLKAEDFNNSITTAASTHVYQETSRAKVLDPLSKKITKARKIFKRITSLKPGKNKKIRALLGKSSYTFQYTHTL